MNHDKCVLVEKWADKLTAEQMRPLLVELVEFAYDAEHVRVGDLAPYWGSNGEPLIEGQKMYPDE